MKEKDRIINNVKKQISEKEVDNLDLKQELNDVSAKFKNLNIKLGSRDEDIKKIKIEYEGRLNEYFQEKAKQDEKLKELMDVVKQQSKEINVRN